jgi:monoamine oxidase
MKAQKDRKNTQITIIGAGLTGLTIAYLLKKEGISARLIEARDRLGGRIYTRYLDGGSIEMGATWLGKKHKQLVKLLEELGLEIFEQFMGERAIYEPMSTTPAQLVQLPHNPDPSFRIAGGSSRLIEKLAASLDNEQVHLNESVKAILFEKEKVRIETAASVFETDLVISTLPPKLLVHSIHFTPDFPASLTEIAEQTHTWMGESIKVGISYAEPFWKEANTSGTIFSNVGPMTEMYDHSTLNESGFALKGFMNSAFHGASREERKKLVLNQLRRFYGEKVDAFLRYEDCVWSQEPYTFTPYGGYILPHQNNGNPIFRKSYYKDRFIIAGSETAKSFPGYMDGAVESAIWAAGLVSKRKAQPVKGT